MDSVEDSSTLGEGSSKSNSDKVTISTLSTLLGTAPEVDGPAPLDR